MGIILDGLEITSDLVWLDEFEWQTVKATVKNTIVGVPVITQSVVSTGRPITLGGENAWITRTKLDQLRALIEIPDHQMTLVMANSDTYNVVFRHWDVPVLTPSSQVGYSKPEGDYIYVIQSLKLMEYTVD